MDGGCKLIIVVPCFNEEEALMKTAPALLKVLGDMEEKNLISPESGLLFVNDGSRDDTWQIICRLHGECGRIRGISLSRNRGHQNALVAGLSYCVSDCDAVITIDADLQDDEWAMEQMVEKYLQGADVVYGVRNDRSSDSWFKRTTAQGFYRFMSFMGVETVPDHADFRLMSRRAVQALLSFPEENLYLRGLVPLIGYKTDTVAYARKPRNAGESKYSLRQMIRLAANGITAMSVKPLRMISWVGALLVLAGIGLFVAKLCGVGSWLLASMWFLTGVTLLSLGVVGTYVGRIFRQVMGRPRYFIGETTDPPKKDRDL